MIMCNISILQILCRAVSEKKGTQVFTGVIPFQKGTHFRYQYAPFKCTFEKVLPLAKSVVSSHQ